jgi:hypothetical protein
VGVVDLPRLDEGRVIAQEAAVPGPTRRSVAAVVALAVVVVISGCGEDGPSLPALPTELPTEVPTSVPTVDVPSPDVTAELPTLPTRSPRPTDDPVGPTEEPEQPTEEPEQPTEEPAPPPTTTAAPVVPPTQEAGPTETARPTPDATPTPTATDATAATAQEEGIPWWVWLLAALLLAAVVALLVGWNRRRAALAAWDDRLTAAVGELRWVEGSLVPAVLRAGTVAEATAVWAAGRPRVLAIDEELFSLAAPSAPDDERRGRASMLRERLAVLTSAVDADTAPDAQADAEGFRTRRGAIEQARTDLLVALDAATTPDPGA